MRHHHELPLTGVMELRPDQLRYHHEISPRDSWNYTLTIEVPPQIVELHPNQTNIMFPSINI